jgi:hypothetical protein
MKKTWLLLPLLAAGLASADESGLVGFRLGLRANATDFSLFGGPSLHAGGLVVSEDFWINPYRRTSLLKVGDHHWEQYQLLRYGFVTGLRYRLGTATLGLLPGVGFENILGSYFGTDASPDWRFEPWAGLEVGFLKYHRLGARWTQGEQPDHSRLRIEWTVQWR